MKRTRLRLQVTRAAANAILEQADYYAERESETLAQRWEKAVHNAMHSLLKLPEQGAPCNFGHPKLQNLRRILVPGFSRHLVFYEYLREKRTVRIVHVIHGARDIESLLSAL